MFADTSDPDPYTLDPATLDPDTLAATFKYRGQQLEIIHHLVSLPDIPPDQAWQYGIDARAPNPQLKLQNYTVIWFQCPWIKGKGTGELMESFLSNMAEKIYPGCYVCIGITTHPAYIKRYCLEEVFGSEVLKKYKSIRADKDFIEKILRHGYRHESIKKDTDIHTTIINHHVTLVFEKKE